MMQHAALDLGGGGVKYQYQFKIVLYKQIDLALFLQLLNTTTMWSTVATRTWNECRGVGVNVAKKNLRMSEIFA